MSGRALAAGVLVALLAGGRPEAHAQSEASPGLIGIGGYVIFFGAEGPLSYATLTPRDVPPEATRVGPVTGRSCQYGVSVPVGGLTSNTRVSGALGQGGYEKALTDIRARHPGLLGIYDVQVDQHVVRVLTVFQRLCVEVTARGFK